MKNPQRAASTADILWKIGNKPFFWKLWIEWTRTTKRTGVPIRHNSLNKRVSSAFVLLIAKLSRCALPDMRRNFFYNSCVTNTSARCTHTQPYTDQTGNARKDDYSGRRRRRNILCSRSPLNGGSTHRNRQEPKKKNTITVNDCTPFNWAYHTEKCNLTDIQHMHIKMWQNI